MKSDLIPVLCGGVFTSSKRDTSQQQTIGRFGVGLKAILLYYNATLTVSSSTINEDNIASYCLHVDDQHPTNALQIIKKRSIPIPPNLHSTLSGTNLMIDKIVGNPSSLYPRVCSYFEHLTALYPAFRLTIQITSFPTLTYVENCRYFT